MPRDREGKFWCRKTIQIIVVIALALWGLVQIVSAVVSRHQISAFVSDALIRVNGSLSEEHLIALGLGLALPACILFGYAMRGDEPRDWLAKPAVAVAVVGITLVLSATIYKSVHGRILREPIGISDAHALAQPEKASPGKSSRNRHPRSKERTAATGESQPPGSGSGEASASSASKYCGCPYTQGGTERPERAWEEPEEEWPEESWEEPEEEWPEESWEEPEEGWEGPEEEWPEESLW